MNDDIYEPLKIFRDFLLNKKDANGADACNTLMERLDNNPKVFIMSEQDAEYLLMFLFHVGYISHEFHSPIIELSNKLSEFIKVNKK